MSGENPSFGIDINPVEFQKTRDVIIATAAKALKPGSVNSTEMQFSDRSDQEEVRDWVVSGRGVFELLEREGLLQLSVEARTNLEEGIRANEDFSAVVLDLCGITSFDDIKISTLHKATERMYARKIAIGLSAGHRSSELEKIGFEDVAAFQELIAGVLPEDQRKIFLVALDAERMFRGDEVGVARSDRLYDVGQVDVKELSGKTMIVYSEGPKGVLSDIFGIQDLTEDSLETALLKYSDRNLSADFFSGYPALGGVLISRGGVISSQGSTMDLFGGLFGGDALNQIKGANIGVIGMVRLDTSPSFEDSHFEPGKARIVGAATGDVKIMPHNHSETEEKVDQDNGSIYRRRDYERPSEGAMRMPRHWDGNGGVKTFSELVLSNSHAFLISPDARRGLNYFFQTETNSGVVFSGVMHAPLLTAYERATIVRELALMGLEAVGKTEDAHPTVAVLQTGDRHLV